MYIKEKHKFIHETMLFCVFETVPCLLFELDALDLAEFNEKAATCSSLCFFEEAATDDAGTDLLLEFTLSLCIAAAATVFVKPLLPRDALTRCTVETLAGTSNSGLLLNSKKLVNSGLNLIHL